MPEYGHLSVQGVLHVDVDDVDLGIRRTSVRPLQKGHHMTALGRGACEFQGRSSSVASETLPSREYAEVVESRRRIQDQTRIDVRWRREVRVIEFEGKLEGGHMAKCDQIFSGSREHSSC